MRATRFIGAAISYWSPPCAVVATMAQEVHYSLEEDSARMTRSSLAKPRPQSTSLLCADRPKSIRALT